MHRVIPKVTCPYCGMGWCTTHDRVLQSCDSPTLPSYLKESSRLGLEQAKPAILVKCSSQFKSFGTKYNSQAPHQVSEQICCCLSSHVPQPCDLHFEFSAYVWNVSALSSTRKLSTIVQIQRREPTCAIEALTSFPTVSTFLSKEGRLSMSSAWTESPYIRSLLVSHFLRCLLQHRQVERESHDISDSRLYAPPKCLSIPLTRAQRQAPSPAQQ